MSERLTAAERAISAARREPELLAALPPNLVGATVSLTASQPFSATLTVVQPYSATLTAKEL